MKEYHKIQSIFKRDHKTKKFIEGEYSLPEFEYLKDLNWVWTEKVDGTNIRVIWDPENKQVIFKGRTERAQLPVHLLNKLNQLFPKELMEDRFQDSPMTLYGEGYGYKIQKVGSKYLGDKVSFVLFDAFCGMWLTRESVEKFGVDLKIKVAPIIGNGTIEESIEFVRGGFNSTWNAIEEFESEGLVIRPQYELRARNGGRIITKIKCVDFR